ncbi:unnamed protein product, partial [Scytosiphon promiscuus]
MQVFFFFFNRGRNSLAMPRPPPLLFFYSGRRLTPARPQEVVVAARAADRCREQLSSCCVPNTCCSRYQPMALRQSSAPFISFNFLEQDRPLLPQPLLPLLVLLGAVG